MVHNHLPSIAVRVTKRRSQVDQRAGRELLRQLVCRDHGLEVGQSCREKGRVGGGDQQTRHPQFHATRLERQQQQVLRGQPVEYLLSQAGEGLAESLGIASLVRWPLVRHDHAIRIAPPHVRFRVVDSQAVLAAHHFGFDNSALAGSFVGHFKPIGPVATQGKFVELLAGFGKHATRRGSQHAFHSRLAIAVAACIRSVFANRSLYLS